MIYKISKLKLVHLIGKINVYLYSLYNYVYKNIKLYEH